MSSAGQGKDKNVGNNLCLIFTGFSPFEYLSAYAGGIL